MEIFNFSRKNHHLIPSFQRRGDLAPLKSLGQNFLVNKNIIRKVINSANLNSDDVVLEIGPGRGALTFELAKYAGRVVAIEKDRGLARELNEVVKNQGLNNVEIIHRDALKIFKNTQLKLFKPELKFGRKIKVISNPPYEIAARLIIDFLIYESAGWQIPAKIVFVIQKEIAQRALARPGDMNILSAITQTFGVPEIIANVPRQCFSPQPRVDSAILAINTIKNTGITDAKKFVRLVKAGFSSKRKFLLNNLAKKLGLDKKELEETFEKIGLNKKIRAEELDAADWKKLLLKSAL